MVVTQRKGLHCCCFCCHIKQVWCHPEPMMQGWVGIPFPTIHGNSGLPFPKFGNEFYSMKKVAKAERKVSGAGDITVKKTPKVVAPEPREPHSVRLTPKGCLCLRHPRDQKRIKSFLGEGPYWETVQGRGRRNQARLQLACIAVNENKDDSSQDWKLFRLDFALIALF